MKQRVKTAVWKKWSLWLLTALMGWRVDLKICKMWKDRFSTSVSRSKMKKWVKNNGIKWLNVSIFLTRGEILVFKQTWHRQVHRAWWVAPMRAGQCNFGATLNYLWKNMAISRGSWELEESKSHFYLQERQEGPSGKLQTRLPHLNLWGGDGATNPGNNFQTYWGQEGD